MVLLFAFNPITLLVYLLIIGIVLAVAYYIINSLFPEPMRRWAILFLVVVAAIFVIYLLLGLVGGGTPRL
jgi:predicted outer membrane lipoprotein